MKRDQMVADVTALLMARNPLLWVTTREEARVERCIAEACARVQPPYAVKFWDCASGITDATGAQIPPGESARDPDEALKAIRESRAREVWVMRDLPKWFNAPTTLRGVRSLARLLEEAARQEARSIVILSPTSDIPPELSGHVVAIDWPLPDREEIAGILKSAIESLPGDLASRACPPEAREAAVDAAVGLTATEAQACYAKSLVTTLAIDPAVVAAEKRRVIARERVLEWHEPDPRGLAAVGGLDNLKAWLVQRRAALSQAARDYGLAAPRGVLLIGPPGCGKSLTAKAIASAWGVPLLRLDLGALKSKWVGESEGNIRRALAVAEAVSPAVLWLDEIEKSINLASAMGTDGGVGADALGTILSWMQEHEGSVFVVATSNDVRLLPPELLRKGRFDEIFWVDLPTVDERRAILRAAIAQHRQDVHAIDVDAIALRTEDFTGAELSALVNDALFAAFSDGTRGVATGDIVATLPNVIPLARTAGDKIDELRKWALGRARPASPAPYKKVDDHGRKLDLPPPKSDPTSN